MSKYYLNNTDKMLFTKHLSVLLKAGIPMSEALSTLSQDSSNPNLVKLTQNLKSLIESGQSLSFALSQHKNIFDPIYLSLILIGEKTGNLDSTLERLSQDMAKLDSLKNKIKNALIYPSLVLGLMFAIIMGLALFVLPKLVDFFDAFEQELPLTTRILLAFANLMQNHGLIITISLIVLAILIYFLPKTKAIKPISDRLVFKMPFFGSFLKLSKIAELSRNMSILLGSGIPLNTSLSTLITIENNTLFRNNLIKLQSSLTQGKSMGETLNSKEFNFFPNLFSKMIKVGEKTGELDTMLLYLADYYSEDLDNASKNLTTALEPTLLLIVGLMVGFLALAIISPIYQITGSIG